mgnify:CR=1 FL=1
MMLLVILPASAALILLSQPVVRLLFQRGAFDDRSTAITAAALAWYALGLISYGLYYLLISAFYALQNTMIRIQAGLVLVGTYIAGNLALIGVMGANGIALSYGLAHTAACILLLARLGRRLQWRVEGAVAGFALRVLVATLVMSAAALLVRMGLGEVGQASFAMTAAATALAGCVGLAVYVVALLTLGVGEVRRLPELLRRRL